MIKYIIIGFACLLLSCKSSRCSILNKNEYEFYSKINKSMIQVYDHSNCIVGAEKTFDSFKENLPRIISKKLRVKTIKMKVMPLLIDSNSCIGVYIYKTQTRNIMPRYLNGELYYMFLIKDNDVLFLKNNDTIANNLILNSFKEHLLYNKMLEYKEEILNNEIYR